MKFKNIRSSSSGNCSILSANNTSIIVDAGVALKNVVQEVETDLMNVSAILITHEHSDHVSQLPRLHSKTKCNIYISKKSFNNLKHADRECISLDRVVFIEPDKEFIVGCFNIRPISVNHDAQENLNYIFYHDNKKFVYLTDLGYSIENNTDIHNAHAYYVESNHDITMVLNSNRPDHLKKRILSDKGHLSNIDCSVLVCKSHGENTHSIIFAHISKDCNTDEYVLETFSEVLESYNIDDKFNKILTSRSKATEWINI